MTFGHGKPKMQCEVQLFPLRWINIIEFCGSITGRIQCIMTALYHASNQMPLLESHPTNISKFISTEFPMTNGEDIVRDKRERQMGWIPRLQGNILPTAKPVTRQNSLWKVVLLWCSCNVYLELKMKLPISIFQKQIFMSCCFFVGVIRDICFNSFIFSLGKKRSKDKQKGAWRNNVRVEK